MPPANAAGLRPGGAFWTVPREWSGGTVFIIGGGPSVASQNTGALRGRHVIAINSSFQRVPFADVLIFGDARWWHVNKVASAAFEFRIVSVLPPLPANFSPVGPVWTDDRVLKLKKVAPPGMARAPDSVMLRRTTLTAAINLAVHFGAKKIVLLGADGQPASDGRTHHHAPHPWNQTTNCWDEQRADLATIVTPLQAMGVTVLNASPGSAIPFWPIVSLEECAP